MSNPAPRLASPVAGGVVLVLFWVLLVAANWNKSATIDEPGTPAAGITHWRFNDYRLDPENGNLPHRLAALPLLGTKLPAMDQSSWLNPEPWVFGYDWLHLSGSDSVELLRRGRAMMAMIAVALAAIVWLWSRSIFGPVGGTISLLVCVLNPGLLANGALMTADTIVALFFLASTWAWWRLLNRLTPGRLAVSALAVAGLLISKMSGVLIVPIALILAVIRIATGRPLELSGFKSLRVLTTRSRIAGAILAAGLVHVAAAYLVLWGAYGFRYSMIAPGQPSRSGSAYLWEPVLAPPSLPDAIEDLVLPEDTRHRARAVVDDLSVPLDGWSERSELGREILKRDVLTPPQATALDARLTGAPPGGQAGRVIRFLARHKVLPEAYLLGALHAVRTSRTRWAFLNGEIYHVGRPGFFAYAFGVKTPLPFLALLAVACWAARRIGLAEPPESRAARVLGVRCTIPLAVLFVCYGVSAVTSGLNIGHRHLLTLYPPLFILAGAAGAYFSQPVGRWGRLAVIVLLGLHAVDTGARFPNYLAYFNGIVAPGDAYRHLVDSSLDWGQDLPGVKRYIDAHPKDAPFHLSYFGAGNPLTYGIEAEFLPSLPGRFRNGRTPAVLAPMSSTTPSPAELAELNHHYPDYNFVGAGTTDRGQAMAYLLRRPGAWELSAGSYLISATLLQQRLWSEFEESNYQALRQRARPIIAPASLTELAAALGQRSFQEVDTLLTDFEEARLNRLAAFLRSRRPEADVGHSILVYKMTATAIAQALDGPPPFRGSPRSRPALP